MSSLLVALVTPQSLARIVAVVDVAGWQVAGLRVEGFAITVTAIARGPRSVTVAGPGPLA